LSGWEELKQIKGLNLSFAEGINLNDTYDYGEMQALDSVLNLNDESLIISKEQSDFLSDDE